MTATVPKPVTHAMQCMEIWGGSHNAENAVSTPGLDLWIYSQPYQEASAGGDVHYVSLCGGGVITRASKGFRRPRRWPSVGGCDRGRRIC